MNATDSVVVQDRVNGLVVVVFFLALICGGLSTAARAQAPSPEPENAMPATDAETVNVAPVRSDAEVKEAFGALGCQASEVLVNEDGAYAACGEAGVFIATFAADGALTLREVRQAPGLPKGLFLRAGTVWVEATRTEALPLKELPLRGDPGTRPSSVPSPAAAVVRVPQAQPTSGVVLRVHDLEVTISFGGQDGLKTGDHIEIYQRVTEDADLGEREQSLAVGEVVALSDHRARVALGLGELVPVGAAARLSTRELSGSKLAPARRGGLLTIEGTLRPFLPIETLSFATLGDVALTYRPQAPVYVRAEVRPFGVMIGDVDNSGAFGGFVGGGYDHQYFSVGIAIGTLFHSEQYYEWTEAGQTLLTSGSGLNFAVMQNARLGALDGLNVTIANAFALDAERDRWEFGFFEGALQIPLGKRTWLLATSGGADYAGYYFGELGLRRLLHGDGGSGSLFVAPAVGFAGIASTEEGNRQLYFGPMIAAHVEFRL